MVAVVVSCSGATSSETNALTTSSPATLSTEPLSMRRFVCAVASGGTSSCINAVVVGERRYTITCTAANPEFVESRVVGRGSVDGIASEARAIQGLDPQFALASRLGSAGCPQQPTSGEWLLTYVDRERSRALVTWLLCARGLPARTETACGPKPN